jgi:hypothetical protein
LKEIIRIRSTSVCDEFATHVNAAIDSATKNDASLGSLITVLNQKKNSDDLMAMGLRRRRAIDSLSALADSITKEWKDGEAEVTHLRDLAAKATDDQERADLKGSADSLGGVLWRQRKIARDLDGYVAYLYAEEMRQSDDWHVQQSEQIPPGWSGNRHSAFPEMMGSLAGDPFAPTDWTLSVRAARDFTDRLPEIARDEGSAATHLSAANEHC